MGEEEGQYNVPLPSWFRRGLEQARRRGREERSQELESYISQLEQDLARFLALSQRLKNTNVEVDRGTLRNPEELKVTTDIILHAEKVKERKQYGESST